MTTRAIIFDFFGTVSTQDPYNRWLRHHGLKREGEFFEVARDGDLGRLSVSEYFKRLSLASSIDPHTVRRELLANIEIDQPVVELIVKLHSNYKIGLISNAMSGILRPILEAHKLSKLFDQIVISSEVGSVKPDPGIYYAALSRLEVHAAEAVFIDDMQEFVDQAVALGAIGIRFTSLSALTKTLKDKGITF